jgi:hypothetical protein
MVGRPGGGPDLGWGVVWCKVTRYRDPLPYGAVEVRLLAALGVAMGARADRPHATRLSPVMEIAMTWDFVTGPRRTLRNDAPSELPTGHILAPREVAPRRSVDLLDRATADL